jgi:beta-glucosidase
MHDLNFPPSQRRLFDEIVKLGKKIILVLYAGRPYTLEQDIHKVNAFMFSFGAGEQSGTAIANLIFGDRSPSAKLAISFPKTTGHIPCYYNYKPSARGRAYKKHGSLENPGRDYVLTSPNAWYPFGYGLSYSKVQYSDLQAEKMVNGNYQVSVTVENIGAYDVDESVLMFLQTLYAPVTPMVKRLRNFAKVHLAKGEKKCVAFTLTDEDFTYVDVNYKKVKLPGAYKIMIEDLELEIEV